MSPRSKNALIQVEDIQDSVEAVLIKAGYSDVAKGYILVPEAAGEDPEFEVYHAGL